MRDLLKYGILFFVVSLSLPAISVRADEDIQYHSLSFDNTCVDSGIVYKGISDGLVIAVSAISSDMSGMPDAWMVDNIFLNIEGTDIKSDRVKKFYVKKGSFKLARAGAALGSLAGTVDISRSDPVASIIRTPSPSYRAFITEEKKDNIKGLAAVFNLDRIFKDRIEDGRDYIKIVVSKPFFGKSKIFRIIIEKDLNNLPRFEFLQLRQDEITDILDTLSGQSDVLWKKRGSAQKSADSVFDEVSFNIENIEIDRAAGYNIWLDRDFRSRDAKTGNSP